MTSRQECGGDIFALKLFTNMRAEDAADTIEPALTVSRRGQTIVHHNPDLPGDGGSIYIPGHLVNWLEGPSTPHISCAPFHWQTHGKTPLATYLC